jgi:hypothetical protein
MQTVFKKGTDLLDYRKIESFQGELKELSEDNYIKLLNSFEKHGFFVPIFVWKNDGHNYCLDGHGRLRVLNKEAIEFDNTSHEVPVVYLEADNEQEAKEKLLKITSQYQKINYDGLYKFIAEAELPEAEIYQAVAFDAMPLISQTTEDEGKVNHIERDGEFLNPEEKYNASEINNIILIYGNDEYQEIMEFIADQISEDYGATPSEVVLNLVRDYKG